MMIKLLILSLLMFQYACTSSESHDSAAKLSPASFDDLKGWNIEQAKAVLPVLLKSCSKLRRKSFDGQLIKSSYDEWKDICAQLAEVDPNKIKFFFEDNFKVYRVDASNSGLFTGYYSPVYDGRLIKEPGFEVPLLKDPDGQQKSAVKKNDSRQVIVQKIQEGKIKDDQVLVWIKDPADKFFLQIQGSGNIKLKDGSVMYVGYAGSNSHDYVSIGRVLKSSGELDEVSMETIRSWLVSHPNKQQELFNKNPRYIFFRKANAGAITAQGVPATSHRTMAVDSRYIPYGTLLWVDTELTASKTPFRQLMVAQDTGSAIKGTVRGDIYMGVGEEAATLAGPQQSSGKLYVIVPK